MKINNKIILPICGFLLGFLCLIIALKKYEIVVNYSKSLPYKFVIIDNPSFFVDHRTLVVEDSLKTLQELAKFHREFLKIPIIVLKEK